MSDRIFTPQEYPLPYIEPDIYQWPIARLSVDKDDFTTAIERTVYSKIEDRHPSLRAELERVLYQERIRITQSRWKADPKDEHRFWNGIKSRLIRLSLMNNKEEERKEEEALLHDIIHRYTHEIVGHFEPKAFQLAGKILPFFFGRIFNAAPGKWFKTISANAQTIHEKIPIIGDVAKIRKLAETGTLIVVPTHFSNMDSIMVGWLLNEVGLPAFTYGAGLNLFSIKLLAYFMSNLGAYKVDRRKKNSVYLETLKTYSREAIERGAHSIFFPGGTRSRSGSLERKLKLGLLGTAVEAQKNLYKQSPDGNAKKIYIVPLIINYHFVLEADALINDYLRETGKERFIRENDDFSTSVRMIRFMLKFLSASSSMVLSFGNPMDVVGNEVDEQGESYNHLGQRINVSQYFMTDGVLRDDQQREEEYTKMLGDRIVGQYFRYNVVMSSHLVFFCAFEIVRRQYDTDVFTLIRTPAEDIRIIPADLIKAVANVKARLNVMHADGEVLLAPELSMPDDKLIDHGISNIKMYHSKSPLAKSQDGSHYYTEDLRMMYFYHNRLEGYKLDKYVG